MKEFRVEIRVKNNLLYTAIDRAGYDSVAAFSRASGVQQSVIGELLNMSAAPINKAGKWRPPVMRIAKALKSLPEDLFPADYLRDTIKNNRVVREYSAEEIRSEMYLEQATPEALMIQADALDTINDAMALLPERHRDVLRMRFGMDGYREHTMEEVAKVFGVTRERIRQIELNAIRRLKAPKYRLSPELLSVDAA